MAPGSLSERARAAPPAGPSQDQKRFRPAASRGFTLLEVVLSMALTALGVLGLSGLLRVMGNIEAEDVWATKALFCTQEGLEEVMYEVHAGTRSAGKGEETLADGPYRGMSRRWAVEPVSILDGLLAVRVECAYDAKGEKETTRLSSLVFCKG